MGEQASNEQSSDHLSDDFSDQYIALERLYSERRWAEVEASAKNLLDGLEGKGNGEVIGNLSARVVLLLGHTRLYGFNDPALAAEHYRRVLGTETETVLLGIAQAGLNQCLTAEEPVSPISSPIYSPMANATPWLQQSSGLELKPSGPSQPTPTAAIAALAPGEPLQTFPGFVQPVQNSEGSKKYEAQAIQAETVPKESTQAESFQAPLTLAKPDTFDEGSNQVGQANSLAKANGPGIPTALSPRESAELTQGLLRLVIQPN